MELTLENSRFERVITLGLAVIALTMQVAACASCVALAGILFNLQFGPVPGQLGWWLAFGTNSSMLAAMFSIVLAVVGDGVIFGLMSTWLVWSRPNNPAAEFEDNND